FDKAATFAGATNAAAAVPSAPGEASSPTTYNQYVATAAANGYCTNSITAGVGFNPATCAGTAAGRNTKFDPASILGTNDKINGTFDSKQFGANVGGPIIKDKLFAFVS